MNKFPLSPLDILQTKGPSSRAQQEAKGCWKDLHKLRQMFNAEPLFNIYLVQEKKRELKKTCSWGLSCTKQIPAMLDKFKNDQKSYHYMIMLEEEKLLHHLPQLLIQVGDFQLTTATSRWFNRYLQGLNIISQDHGKHS